MLVSQKLICSIVITIAAFCLGLFSGQRAFAEAPASDALARQAQQCRELLESSVLDFYLPGSIDKTHGGYLEHLDSEGRFTGHRGKFLVLQARQMWLFSTLAAADIRREECIAAADVGYKFLQEHFLDKVSGGYFSRVKQDGSPEDTRKHMYCNSFVLYGLVEYYRATKKAEALRAAWALFDIIEANSYDKEYGGYQEFFYQDWTPITDPGESRYVGAINTKTYNTHLHLLEAFTQLYLVSPKPLIQRRLVELMQINTVTVRHPRYPCNIDGWTRDWRMIEEPSNLKASYGHDVECAWLVFEAARALQMPLTPLRGWAVSTVNYSMKYGYDSPHGGFFYTGPLEKPADDVHKEWWTQSEALVSMLEMYRLTDKREYYDAFDKTFQFVTRHQIAHDELGGWFAARNPDGSPHPTYTSRTSAWHGGYHNGRALLLCWQILDELAKDDGK